MVHGLTSKVKPRGFRIFKDEDQNQTPGKSGDEENVGDHELYDLYDLEEMDFKLFLRGNQEFNVKV